MPLPIGPEVRGDRCVPLVGPTHQRSDNRGEWERARGELGQGAGGPRGLCTCRERGKEGAGPREGGAGPEKAFPSFLFLIFFFA